MSKKQIKLELEVLEERIAPSFIVSTPGVDMVIANAPDVHPLDSGGAASHGMEKSGANPHGPGNHGVGRAGTGEFPDDDVFGSF